MKISWIKSKKDNDSFRLAKGLGMDVYELDDLEKTDETIEKIIQNKSSTIVVSNEVAGFSENIAKKYIDRDVTIFIAPNKDKKI